MAIPEWHAAQLGEHNVIVKNTFIEFSEEPPGPQDLNRSQSAPAQSELHRLSGIECPVLDPYSSDDGGGLDNADAICSPVPSRKVSEDDVTHFEEMPHKPALDTCGERPQDALPASIAPQPQTLSLHQVSGSMYSYQVVWTVDARKLKGNDKQAVSPPFALHFSEQHRNVTFKMMMCPKGKDEGKGGGPGSSTFKKTDGMGIIQLKCEGDLSSTNSSVRFRLATHNKLTSQRTELSELQWFPTEFVQHNFSHSALCGLPKSNDVWDFAKVIDKDSMTFNVYLWVETQKGESSM